MDYRTHTTNNIGSKWETQEEDNAGTKREIFFTLINHASSWYFDMWGGFYQTEEIRDLIRRLNIVFEKYKNDKSPSLAETLLIADPQSAYYINEKKPQALAMSRTFRDTLNKTGAPFDVYSFNDIPEIEMSRYKVIFLPAMFLITPEREKILKKYFLNNNRTIVWVYAPGICNGENLDTSRIKKWTGTDYGTTGPALVDMGGWNSVYAYDYGTMTSAALKNIMTKAGVHQYTNEENPVFANERLLSVHFKDGGKKRITLPKVYRKVVDVMTEKVVAEKTSEFFYYFDSPDTILFEVIK